MAAYVVCPSEREWEVLEAISAQSGEGAIYVSPRMQRWLVAQGVRLRPGELIDYDFGDEPDLFVDFLRYPEDYALEALEAGLATRVRSGENDANDF